MAEGFWLHMAPGTPHVLVAMEPAVMLLTLVRRWRERRCAGVGEL